MKKDYVVFYDVEKNVFNKKNGAWPFFLVGNYPIFSISRFFYFFFLTFLIKKLAWENS